MPIWKSRAVAQDRYRREFYTGTIVARHSDGTYTVALPGIEETLHGVLNSSGITFQAGNRVVLQRLSGRNTWQIQSAVGGAAPGRAVNPGAVLGTPPLVTWEALPRTATDPTTIGTFVAANGGSGGGMAPETLRALAAAGLAGLLGQGVRPPALPTGVGYWPAVSGQELELGSSCGAYVYPTVYEALRAGAYPADAQTVAYWKLDEANAGDSARDCSGNGNDLTPYNMGPSAMTPFFRGREFAGSALTRPQFNLSTLAAATWEFWFKPDTLSTSAGQMFLHSQDFQCSWHTIYGGELNFQLNTGTGTGTTRYAPPNPAALVGNWHYLAVTYDGSQVCMYLDGAPAGNPVPLSGTVRYSGGTFALGYHTYSGQIFFDGLLDEVRISNVCRTATEIATAWQGRLLHQAVTAPLVTTAGRHMMIGSLAALNGGTVTLEICQEDGVWVPATPWAWTSFPTAATTWRARATLTGQAEVNRWGMVGLPA